MLLTFRLIRNYSIQIYIFNTLENISLHVWIHLFQSCDQLFDLHTLGTVLLIITCRTGICELACTLNEMQIIIISPCFNIILTDHIQRTDQLHSFKICAVQFRHHRLYLCRIEHSHQDCLYHVIIVMSQCNLVAPHLLCMAVQISAAHSRAQITWGLFDIIDGFKDI